MEPERQFLAISTYMHGNYLLDVATPLSGT